MKEIDACIVIKEGRVFQKDSGQYPFSEQYYDRGVLMEEDGIHL